MTTDDLRAFIAKFATITRAMPRPPELVYRSLYEFLDVHGRAWPLIADNQHVHAVHVHAAGCFANAYRLARRWPRRYRYVEGVAAGIIPVHHAWCVNGDDEVIDQTWDRFATMGTAYVGVVVELDDVRWIRTKLNESVFDQWQRRHPAFSRAWTGRVPRVEWPFAQVYS